MIKSMILFMISMAGWALGLGLLNVLLAVWFNRLGRDEMAESNPRSA
jgi:hypothetical protein